MAYFYFIQINLGATKLVKRFVVQGSDVETDDLYPTEYYILYSEVDAGYWTAFEIPAIGAVRYTALTDRYERHEYPLVTPARVWHLLVEITAVYPVASQTSLHIELYGCDALETLSGT